MSEAKQVWRVEANCWRRGPDGSIASYSVSTLPGATLVRFLEFEDKETLTDEEAMAAAKSLAVAVAKDLFPHLLHAVRAAQGIDPDKPTSAPS